jgi:hypothetical protein
MNDDILCGDAEVVGAPDALRLGVVETDEIE